MIKEKIICPRCHRSKSIKTYEQVFWSHEEGHIMANVIRQCRKCDGKGFIIQNK